MIPRRYVWLLRDETTLYDMAGRCKLCSALERPVAPREYGGLGIVVRRDQARHLAAHRHEKITADIDPEAAVIAAATERT